jgi:SagB-type dehydrogenase family enzyme
MSEGIGDRFQRETKYFPNKMSGRELDWPRKPETYKEYPGAARIELPEPRFPEDCSFKDVVNRRRSVRQFSEEPLTLEHVSALLWASNGIGRVESGFEFRTVPSAGALYPVETYLVVNDVEDTKSGVYHYAVRAHALEEIRSGDHGRHIAMAALGQEMCARAPVVFVWTAVFGRSKWKYEERAYRYVYLDAGHVGHGLALAATALGLGSCQIAALFDDEINKILGVDGEAESVVYMSVVGHPRC